MEIQPFEINIAQSVLDDLQKRLGRTRFSDQVEGAGWDYGTNLDYMKELVGYWRDGFDWRKQEAALNQFSHFKANIDGLNIHFIHERGKGPNPMRLILTHGWPMTFYEFDKVIPMLTDPASYGGDAADSFDVIVPSIPGFGFSDHPLQRGWTIENTADVWSKLMTEGLGYEKYAAFGNDWGSAITRYLAFKYPQQLHAIHLMYLGHPDFSSDKSNLTDAEQQYQQYLQGFMMKEGGYAMIQSTKPQSIGFDLNDSPSGLAAWIIEKFQSLSDSHGDIESRFTKDELLTNIMIYWVTQSATSAARTYYENSRLKPPLQPGERIEVPTGVALFDSKTPREWAERSLNIVRWTQMPRGGHFAALEEPALLVDDLRTFFRDYRS
jgi:pimeloyl-ACP methyl ester carboxylesterase